MPDDVIATDVPARLDRLRWGRFHTLVVLALGITWILDGLEVTLTGAIAGALKSSPVLHLTDAQVGLAASVGDLSPAELSGGMQKRVALARAIAAQPDIMFFDEPTTGLDPIMGAVIGGLIVDCVKHLGSTAVAITHDMASARRIGDSAAMLHGGRIVWSGPASELMDSGNPEVDQFTHGRREGPIQMELRG